MTQLIIQGTTLDDFLFQVKKTVSETLLSETQVKPEKSAKQNYLTRSEVAERLNISLPTLNEYTKRGIVPAYRIGARVLYKESEIENSLNQIVSTKFKK